MLTKKSQSFTFLAYLMIAYRCPKCRRHIKVARNFLWTVCLRCQLQRLLFLKNKPIFIKLCSWMRTLPQYSVRRYSMSTRWATLKQSKWHKHYSFVIITTWTAMRLSILETILSRPTTTEVFKETLFDACCSGCLSD